MSAPDYENDLVFPPRKNRWKEKIYSLLAIIAGIITAGICYLLIGWQIILVVLSFWAGIHVGFYIGDD